MHSYQRALLDLAATRNLASMSLREIGRLIGAENPQTVRYHLDRLIANGLLRENRVKGLIERVNRKAVSRGIVPIPILGSANCGPAILFADQNLEGYLQVSESMLPTNKKDIFAIKAIGPSMNRADINGRTIEDGDYVLVDGKVQRPKDGMYVLSVIDDVANIKKFVLDKANEQIVLVSESTQEFPPIHIHLDDQSSYQINGQVVQVLKRPR